jgi:hypothetical protein
LDCVIFEELVTRGESIESKTTENGRKIQKMGRVGWKVVGDMTVETVEGLVELNVGGQGPG